MVVAKRRLSPTSSLYSKKNMSESTSSSCSAFDDSDRDEIYPLYSDLIGLNLNHEQTHRSSVPTMTTSSVEDDNDSFADDLSSTCSARLGVSRSNANTTSFFNRPSTARSVASEPPSLPQYWGVPPPRETTSSSFTARSTLVFTAKKRKSPIYMMVAVFCAIGMFLYEQSHATLHVALRQVVQFTEHRKRVHAKFDSIEQDIQLLQRQMMEITANMAGGLPSLSDMLSGDEELTVLQAKLKEGSAQIGTLQKRLQEMHKHDAMLKYGSGKIRVELELEFPSTSSHTRLKDAATRKSNLENPTMVMEMAPLDMMPHSVFMFLEMVDARLFDGCSFILNAMHVIKAAPLPYDGSSAAAKVRSFAQKGLESVAFREYSPDFPHDPFTVGFAVDGSPSFYINTQDNSDIHVGEPCFAKIISGHDTVKRMEEAPTRNGIWYRQRIGIKRATIL